MNCSYIRHCAIHHANNVSSLFMEYTVFYLKAMLPMTLKDMPFCGKLLIER